MDIDKIYEVAKKINERLDEGKTMKVKIWTYFYNPFVMGGSVYIPTGCEIEVENEVDLGGGYKGYEICVPDKEGKIVIAEKTSGAIVGTSLDEVKEDIKSGDPELMKRQVESACKELSKVRIVSPEEFWKTYCKKR